MIDLKLTFKRTDTKPGDILIRLNTGGIIGETISAFTGSQLVHGGLAVGENRVIEVNGDLPPDTTGKNRFLANIYRSDLTNELKENEYLVFRCEDQDLAARVAVEAHTFVRVGVDKGWGYNLVGAVKALFQTPTDPERQPLLSKGQAVANYGSISTSSRDEIERILKSKAKYFCTQWIVVMYVQTAKSISKGVTVGIDPDRALPGALAEALDKSKDFTFKGVIRR